ncbi:MAG: hypothetical protein ACRD5I_16815 [Candidatus Acidiferrales bacterium]
MTFDGAVRLHLFNGSSGYEGWSLTGPTGVRIIALGGGELVREQRDLQGARLVREAATRWICCPVFIRSGAPAAITWIVQGREHEDRGNTYRRQVLCSTTDPEHTGVGGLWRQRYRHHDSP